MASKITFQELVDEFSNATGKTKVFSRKFIRDIFASIEEGLRKDEHVNIKGLGIFKLQEVPERETKNPRTGITNRIPAHHKIVFKPEKGLREKVNARYADLKPKPLESTPEAKQPSGKETRPEAKPGAKPADDKKAEKKPPENKSAVVFDDTGDTKKKEETEKGTPSPPPPPPDEKKKMPTFIIEEKKKKSPWRWILPLVLIILIFIVLFVVPAKFDSFEKMRFLRNNGDKEATGESTDAGELPGDIFREAPKPGERESAESPEPEAAEAVTEARPKKPESDPSKVAGDERTFIHIIETGNTLWGLADTFYQRTALWPNIYRKNIEEMRTPDLLIIGRELLIPELEGRPYSLTKVDSARISQGYYLAYRAYKKYHPDKADAYLRVAEKFSTTR